MNYLSFYSQIQEKRFPYKLRNDLNVYCPKQLESVFKHPSMNVSTFTNNDLKNIHHENKSTLLTGDFNVNFINYNKKRGKYNFFE